MEIAGLAIGVAVLVIGAVTLFYARRSAQSSSKQAEIGRTAYLDSRPCQLNAIARIVDVDEGFAGGISLQVEISNDGLGRAFNFAYEARSTFLWDFDHQQMVREAQELNLSLRAPAAAKSRNADPRFGFNGRLDMPTRIRDAGLQYLEPGQRHSITDLFFVPWAYSGHPSEHQLRPLESQGPVPPASASSGTRYERNESLPPGMLLYGTYDSEHGDRGKAFLFGPGNGLQLILRFSHSSGDETKFFALPYPLATFDPKPGREFRLVETDSGGADLHESTN